MPKIPVYDSQRTLTKEADVIPVDVSLYGQQGRSFQEAGKGFSALGEKLQEVHDIKATASALAEQEKMKSDLDLWRAENPNVDQKTLESKLQEYQANSKALISRIPSQRGKAEAGLLAFKNANEMRVKWTVENIKRQGQEALAEGVNLDQQIIEKQGRGEDASELIKQRNALRDRFVSSNLIDADNRAKEDIDFDKKATDAVVGRRYSEMVLSGDASQRYKFMKELNSMKVNGKDIPNDVRLKYMELASNAEKQDKINEAVEEGQSMTQAEITTLQTGPKKIGKVYVFEPMGASPKFDKVLEEMNNAKDQKANSALVPTDPKTLNDLRLMMINNAIPDEEKRLAIVTATRDLKLNWKDWDKVESLRSMPEQDQKLAQEGLHYIEDWAVKNNFNEPSIKASLQNDFLEKMAQKKDESMTEIATGVTNSFLVRRYPSLANQKVMPNSVAQAQGGFKILYQPLTGKRSPDATKPDATIPSTQDPQYEYKTVGGKTYRKKKVNA